MLKSSSRAAAKLSQSPPGCDSPRKISRSPSTRACAAAITSSEKSIGFDQWPVRKKSSTASRPQRRTTSRSGAMLPTDFDIFSLSSCSSPLCSQMRANSRPAACDCARSFSWCGNTRSRPPRWMSKPGPRNFSAIAEHSMCQPGRPRPHGESHHVSSPSLFAFQSEKSRGSRLRGFGSCSST